MQTSLGIYLSIYLSIYLVILLTIDTSLELISHDCLLSSFINNRNELFRSICKEININNNNNNEIDNDIKLINDDGKFICKLLQNN
jgi:hypothetical protein